jgi:hypothetical protein
MLPAEVDWLNIEEDERGAGGRMAAFVGPSRRAAIFAK